MGSADKVHWLEPKVLSALFLHFIGDPVWPPCRLSGFPESPDAFMPRPRQNATEDLHRVSMATETQGSPSFTPKDPTSDCTHKLSSGLSQFPHSLTTFWERVPQQISQLLPTQQPPLALTNPEAPIPLKFSCPGSLSPVVFLLETALPCICTIH